MVNCPTCGHEKESPDNAFCTSCGFKFEEPEITGEPRPEPEITGEPRPEPEPASEFVISQSGAYIQFDGGPSIYFDEQHQKVVGRSDISDYLKSNNQNPLQVSRQHFTIFKQSSNYYITDGNTSVQDKESSNKTQVNGKVITGTGQHELKDGDTIKVAGLVEATFHLNSQQAPPAADSQQAPPAADSQQAPPAADSDQAQGDKEQTFEQYEADYLKRVQNQD